MNTLNEILKAVNFKELEQYIKNSNISKKNYLLIKKNNEINFAKKIKFLYKNIFKKFNITGKTKVLDIGSGFCHSYFICKSLNIDYIGLDKSPTNSDELCNLYYNFCKKNNINVIIHNILEPDDIVLSEKFNYILLVNQTFDEKQHKDGCITVWGIDEWKVFFTKLNNYLLPGGKIIVNWSKQKLFIKDKESLYNRKNGNIIKYLHNKNYIFFKKNKQYNVVYLNDKYICSK